MLITTELFFMISDPRFKFGWATNITQVIARVSSIAMIAAVFSFVVPKCGKDMFTGPKALTDKSSFTALIGWKIVAANFPWGILIFICGGLSIAAGTKLSKMDDSIADTLANWKPFKNT